MLDKQHSYDNKESCRNYYKKNKEIKLLKQIQRRTDDWFGSSLRTKNSLIFLLGY